MMNAPDTTGVTSPVTDMRDLSMTIEDLTIDMRALMVDEIMDGGQADLMLRKPIGHDPNVRTNTMTVATM